MVYVSICAYCCEYALLCGSPCCIPNMQYLCLIDMVLCKHKICDKYGTFVIITHVLGH